MIYHTPKSTRTDPHLPLPTAFCAGWTVSGRPRPARHRRNLYYRPSADGTDRSPFVGNGPVAVQSFGRTQRVFHRRIGRRGALAVVGRGRYRSGPLLSLYAGIEAIAAAAGG